MAQFITSILTNSQALLIVILFYFIALWLMFCLWVFVDASRRYHNVLIAVFFTLLVFVFNFPILIFYLIIRPEDDYAVVNDGTVNVPVANFVGDDGEVVMSLNLKINGQPSSDSNMNVNVDWKANNSSEVHTMSKKVVFGGSNKAGEQSSNLLKSKLENFRAKAESSLKQVVDSSKQSVDTYNQEHEGRNLNQADQVDNKPAKSGKSSRKNKQS